MLTFPHNIITDEDKYLYLQTELKKLEDQYKVSRKQLLDEQKKYKPKFIESVAKIHQGRYDPPKEVQQAIGSKSFVIETTRKERGNKANIQKYLDEWFKQNARSMTDHIVHAVEDILAHSTSVGQAKLLLEQVKEKIANHRPQAKNVVKFIWSQFKDIKSKATLKRKPQSKEYLRNKKVKNILSDF